MNQWDFRFDSHRRFETISPKDECLDPVLRRRYGQVISNWTDWEKSVERDKFCQTRLNSLGRLFANFAQLSVCAFCQVVLGRWLKSFMAGQDIVKSKKTDTTESEWTWAKLNNQKFFCFFGRRTRRSYFQGPWYSLSVSLWGRFWSTTRPFPGYHHRFNLVCCSTFFSFVSLAVHSVSANFSSQPADWFSLFSISKHSQSSEIDNEMDFLCPEM